MLEVQVTMAELAAPVEFRPHILVRGHVDAAHRIGQLGISAASPVLWARTTARLGSRERYRPWPPFSIRAILGDRASRVLDERRRDWADLGEKACHVRAEAYGRVPFLRSASPAGRAGHAGAGRSAGTGDHP